MNFNNLSQLFRCFNTKMRRKEGKGCRQTVHKYSASGCAQGLLTIIKCADLEEGNEPFAEILIHFRQE